MNTKIFIIMFKAGLLACLTTTTDYLLTIDQNLTIYLHELLPNNLPINTC